MIYDEFKKGWLQHRDHAVLLKAYSKQRVTNLLLDGLDDPSLFVQNYADQFAESWPDAAPWPVEVALYQERDTYFRYLEFCRDNQIAVTYDLMSPHVEGHLSSPLLLKRLGLRSELLDSVPHPKRLTPAHAPHFYDFTEEDVDACGAYWKDLFNLGVQTKRDIGGEVTKAKSGASERRIDCARCVLSELQKDPKHNRQSLFSVYRSSPDAYAETTFYEIVKPLDFQ